MINFSGLVSGLDTNSIIEGLLQIQQRQVDQQNARRAVVLGKQAAFSGVEGRLSSFRTALGKLSSLATSAVRGKLASSSDEDLLTATASSRSASGTYKIHVQSLATAHTVASQSYASANSAISTGSLTLQVGSGTATTITINSGNNTLSGLADAINRSDAEVSASVVRDGASATEPYKLLLTSKKTGAANSIAITSSFAAPTGDQITPTFNLGSPVQAAADAEIRIGNGAGAITAKSATNRFTELIDGVTINVQDADPTKEITLTVEADVERGLEAINDFVKAYNDLSQYIDDQVRYNAATGRAGTLIGDRTVVAIQQELQQAISTVVGGVDTDANRLSAIGVTFNDKGQLQVDSGKVRQALHGELEGVDTNAVARLFALGADSNAFGIQFVVGSTRTQEGSIQVDITSAAEQAQVTGTTDLAASIVVDNTNNTLQLKLDGVNSSTLTLRSGTYTAAEYAILVQDTINADPNLGGQEVIASVSGGKLRITTEAYGSTTRLDTFSGSALATMGFTGSESDVGQDVVGRYIVDGQIETATGRGTLLIGDADNANTADLQVRATLSASEVTAGIEGTLTVTRGLASRLDLSIGAMMDEERGRIKTANERYTKTAEGIQASIDRLNARFEAQKESLLKQFTALENVLGQLQTTGNFIGAQLASLG